MWNVHRGQGKRPSDAICVGALGMERCDGGGFSVPGGGGMPQLRQGGILEGEKFEG